MKNKSKLRRLEIVLYGTIPCIVGGVLFGYKVGATMFWFVVWILMLFSYYFDEE